MTGWANYDSALEQMRSVGLDVDHFDVGRMRRVRTQDDRGAQKSGWYSLHELRTKTGEYLLVGAFGNWREGTDGAGRPVSHRIEIGKETLTPDERAAVRARMAEDRKRAQAKRKHEAERAARRAAAAWLKCEATGTSAYLERKGVQALGARFSPGGNLVVPMQDEHGSVHGLQVIYSDPQTKKRKGRDKDFWPAGIAKRGHFYLVGAPTWIVLVCEGFATGASLHMATGWPVAVAFDAGNLEPVAQRLRKRYHDARVLVCADDDWIGRCGACGKRTPVAEPACQHCGEAHGKHNAGSNAASVAALAVNGAWVAPAFGERDESHSRTDFNDLHQAEGLHVVRAQLEGKVRELGWRSGARERPKEDTPADPKKDFRFSMDVLLRDYALIYSTETAFDARRRMIVHLGPLRNAAGKSLVRSWLEHPDRRTVMPDQVVFDPERDPDDEEVCNLWGGWPTAPRSGSCEVLLDLLEYLCGREDHSAEVQDWVLRWLAYPIQHPGAKMQTALLMHGPEGTGKNTFFGCIRKIYDKYGCIFSQTELESQFNGWASSKLFAIGNEVVSRAELYQQQGRLKNMITEREWMINEKNLPTRLESNHCNFVFFSNRLDIAKLDKQDRRYCVIWTPEAMPENFYQGVADEIDNGGVAALHDYLLNLDLRGFTPHTKPPLTRAKMELIDIGMDSVERFWRDWSNGHLDVPFAPCLSQDLYAAYRHWAQLEGVPKPAPQYILLGAVGKKQGLHRRREWYLRGATRAQGTVITPAGHEPGADDSRQSWLSGHIEAFRAGLDEWREMPR